MREPKERPTVGQTALDQGRGESVEIRELLKASEARVRRFFDRLDEEPGSAPQCYLARDNDRKRLSERD